MEVDAALAHLIETCGDQSYWKAVEFVVIAHRLGDSRGARLYGLAGQELVRRGYHKFLCREETAGMPGWGEKR
jgi:hypothetical protein